MMFIKIKKKEAKAKSKARTVPIIPIQQVGVVPIYNNSRAFWGRQNMTMIEMQSELRGHKFSDIGTKGVIKNITLANQRRKAYKQRHEKDRHIKNSSGYFADKLL